MIFIHPEFLYGLTALAIPIIIHLFNFRRHKKLYFSDISRLKSIITHTKKQQKLKHLLVLLLRILTIFFIVFALAGPELKEDEGTQINNSPNTAIFIDNSFSMMAEGQNGRLFENARQDALELVENSADNTRFIILSNSNDGQQNQMLGKKAATTQLENLKITPETKRLSQIITSRNRIIKNSELTRCNTYIFSDFQKNSTDIVSLPADSTNYYYFIPFQHLQNKNIYIDSCYIENPDIMTDKVIKLIVWVKNDSDTDYEKVPLKLSINNQQKAVSGIDIKAGSSKQINLNFTVSKQGWQHGLIEIEDFPITFDDKMYFAFEVINKINVLIIGDQNSNNYIEKFYSSDEIFNITNMNYRAIDFSELKNYSLIILNGIPNISSGLVSQVKQTIEDGANILFIPPSLDDNIENTSSFFNKLNAGTVVGFDTTETRITKLKLTSNLFKESINKVPQNADLPVIKKHYIYNFPVKSNVEALVTMLSGDDFLSKKNIGSGQLFILSTGLDPEFGNFTSHLLFAPIMHGVTTRKESLQKLFYTIGKNNNIIVTNNIQTNNETPLSLFSPHTSHSVIPGQEQKNGKLHLSLANVNMQNGYYNLMITDSILAIFAFNYNRSESNMIFFNSDELTKQCSISGIKHYTILDVTDPEYKEVINAIQNESSFWKLFIIFALFTILMEILILRFWK